MNNTFLPQYPINTIVFTFFIEIVGYNELIQEIKLPNTY